MSAFDIAKKYLSAVKGDPAKTTVMEVFPGSKVIHLARRCEHCSQSKELEGAPAWRRNGRIIQRIEAGGEMVWACHSCGRKARQ